MKKLTIFILFSGFHFGVFAQFNIQGQAVAEGYDVTEYFLNKAVKGKSSISATYGGGQFWFSNRENKNKFLQDPEKYLPQYGGWCAYAMGRSGNMVHVDPETFEIRDGKLYLFYHTIFINTHEKWLEQGPEELRSKADRNWSKLIENE